MSKAASKRDGAGGVTREMLTVQLRRAAASALEQARRTKEEGGAGGWWAGRASAFMDAEMFLDGSLNEVSEL